MVKMTLTRRAAGENIPTRSVSEESASLTLLEAALLQARRADISNAGGVSHRFANVNNLRPEGPTQVRLCRPFGPELLYFPRTGGSRHRLTMCRASSPDEIRNFKNSRRPCYSMPANAYDLSLNKKRLHPCVSKR